MLKSLDLFTGYGGITLALKDWCKPIAYVEIEEYAQKIISYRMADGSLPRAPILADVKNIKGEIGDCDIIIGGFPCQDISVAGNGAGLEGERSGLYFEILRLAKEIKPTFLFLENVPAIRTRGLDVVVRSLSEIGYDCRWTTVAACDVGAPHKRERWFLLAYANSEPLWDKQGRECREYREDQAEPRGDGNKEPLADSSKSRLERRARDLWFKRYTEFSGKTWQEIEPTVCRGTYGPATRVDRIKALGNGVVPLQARTAFMKLMGLEDKIRVLKGEKRDD